MPPFVPSLADDAVIQALGDFLDAVLPGYAGSVQGQDNRVAQPKGANYAVLTPMMQRRLSTNVDVWADCAFTGSADAQGRLSVSSVLLGVISAGMPLYGLGVAPGTTVGMDSASIAPAAVLPFATYACGGIAATQATDVTVQCDLYGPASADNAAVLSTLFRGVWAADWFEAQGWAGKGLTPLYADDPRQMPFWNAESQNENRWSIDVHMQADRTVTVPQDFADRVTINLFPADAA